MAVYWPIVAGQWVTRHFHCDVVQWLSGCERFEPGSAPLAHLVLDEAIVQLGSRLAAGCGHTGHIWAKPRGFVCEVGVCEQFGAPLCFLQ